MQQRIAHIDLAAGIMILWMIIYHALIDADINATNPCVLFPYLSFFMPWFFYKSGQFFRKRPWKEHVSKDARKLLRTFVIWSIIGYVMFLMFGMLQHTLTLRSATYSIVRGLLLRGAIPLDEPLWFLLTLFGVRFAGNQILPDRGDKYGWIRVGLIVIIGFVGAYACYRWNHRLLPYWVANGLSGLTFFALGYGLRGYENKWWIIAPAVVVYIVCCVVGFPVVDMMFNKLLDGTYLFWIPIALCGIVTFNMICRMVSRYIFIKPLEIVGQYAMIIYVTHELIVLTIQFVVNYFRIEALNPYMVWVYIIGYALLLPICCIYLPRLKHFKFSK